MSRFSQKTILSLNLTRAIQLCVDIAMHLLADTPHPAPSTMADAFLTLADDGVISRELADRIRRAVGFRNIVIHNYTRIDWEVVHVVTHDGLDDLRNFAKSIVRILNEES